MSVQDRLLEALHGADDYRPSPDLFARVKRSIEEDAAHRRRVQWVLLAVGSGLAALAAWVLALGDFTNQGLAMPWWAAQVAVTAVTVALVATFGPLIRRFGRIFVSDVFHPNPETGRRFLALLDVAYYLIFGSLILLAVQFQPEGDWFVDGVLTPRFFESQAEHIGVVLLLMGLLHAVAIFCLPFIGLIFSSTWHRTQRGGGPPDDPGAQRVERITTIITWLAYLAIITTWIFIMFVIGAGVIGG